MPRIAGVDVPNEKRIDIALTRVYGIGLFRSRQILTTTRIDASVRAGKLAEDEVSRIANVIEEKYVVEGQLRRQIQQNIARLRDIRCYRGLRHIRGLPVRGQRTRTNARTRKGPKKTVAGKKGIKEMHRG
ncbi:MAG: 30S ribosomal protein S13 [Planctomycetes bacterium]|nr:30S ribosomal protein S13 [Planctomycetota bacterium]